MKDDLKQYVLDEGVDQLVAVIAAICMELSRTDKDNSDMWSMRAETLEYALEDMP